MSRVRVGRARQDGTIPCEFTLDALESRLLVERLQREGPCPKCARAAYGLACDEHTRKSS